MGTLTPYGGRLWQSLGGALVCALLAAPVAAETRQVAPIWSRIVVWAVPDDFASAFASTRGGSYLQEFVPRGQSVQDWREMITVTGTRGLAEGRRDAARDLAGILAHGYQEACPRNFSATAIPAPGVDGASEVFAGHLSCAELPGTGYGEAMVFIVARAGPDVFTFQWAMRARPGGVELINGNSWGQRLKALAGGLRLCPKVSGEAAPYPSCTG